MLWSDLPFIIFVCFCVAAICLCIAGIVHESSDTHETIIGKVVKNASSSARKHH